MNFYKEQVLTVLSHLLPRPPSSLGSNDVVFLFGWGREKSCEGWTGHHGEPWPLQTSWLPPSAGLKNDATVDDPRGQ